MSWATCFVCLITLSGCRDDGAGSFRTLEFEISEVTSPDVAISPDGTSIVFTMLGHLFRVSPEGGVAEQLTFGSYYHQDPAFSPNGHAIAFTADRDESEGNVFVLDLRSGRITQVTHERWAARPAWSPDGSALIYLSYPPGNRRCQGQAAVMRLDFADSSATSLTGADRIIRSPFFTADGIPGWAAVQSVGYDSVNGHPSFESVVELYGRDRNETAIVVNGRVDRVVPDSSGRRFFVLRDIPWGVCIRNSTSIWLVIKGGQVFDPEAMRQNDSPVASSH